MQHAMWVGRQDNLQLGGVAGHLYVEFDGGPTRSRAPARGGHGAGAGAIRCCGCGSCPTAPSASRRPGSATHSRSRVEDLRHLDGDDVDQRLAAIRDAKSHQQLDGAVFELALTRLPGGRSRLHVDLDMQAADAMSYRTLMADLAALYLGRDLPALGYTYRQYRHAVEAEEARPQPARIADREWWAQRIPQLPDPPTLAHHRRPPTRIRAPGAGTGWTRQPATPCSRAPRPAASPRR